MAVNARVNTGSNIGQVKLTQRTRSTIASQNFTPKPNVSVSELTDVNTTGVQDGFTLVFNSDTSKFEAGAGPEAVITSVNGGSF